MVKYGKDNPSVVVLDADVSASTKTSIFGAACPDRFFNVGIAEANMAAMAAGFASVGKIPFVNTFAVFLSSLGLLAARTFGSYSKLGIKFAGAYGGLSDSFDGPSHHSVEDLTIMRSLPNFKVFVASDAANAEWMVKHAIEKPRDPMYIRLSRDVFPDLYREGELFEEGKGMVLREGKDVAIIACGIMVSKALEASDILAKEGVEAAVVDMFCIKPIDSALIAGLARHTGALVTAEEHSIIGGLGGAVAEALCREGAHAAVGFVGLNDTHAECGPYGPLMEKYGLSAAAIAEKAREALLRKIFIPPVNADR